MSDPLIIALMVCLAILGSMAMACFTMMKLDEREADRERESPIISYPDSKFFEPNREVTFAPGQHEYRPSWHEHSKTVLEYPQNTETPAGEPQEVKEPESPEKFSPLAVDPKNPPKFWHYKSSPGTPTHCFCHRAQIEEGQRMLLFPVPNSKAYRILCTDGRPATWG